jgi:hypothetical protein
MMGRVPRPPPNREVASRAVVRSLATVAAAALLVALAGCGLLGDGWRVIEVGDVLNVRGESVRGLLNDVAPLWGEWAWGAEVRVPPTVSPRDVVAVAVGVGARPAWGVAWVGEGDPPPDPFPTALTISRARWAVTLWAGGHEWHVEVELAPRLGLTLEAGCAAHACRYLFDDPDAARRVFAFEIDVAAVDPDWWVAWAAGDGRVLAVVYLEVWLDGATPFGRHRAIEFDLVSSGSTVILSPNGAAPVAARP